MSDEGGARDDFHASEDALLPVVEDIHAAWPAVAEALKRIESEALTICPTCRGASGTLDQRGRWWTCWRCAGRGLRCTVASLVASIRAHTKTSGTTTHPQLGERMTNGSERP